MVHPDSQIGGEKDAMVSSITLVGKKRKHHCNKLMSQIGVPCNKLHATPIKQQKSRKCRSTGWSAVAIKASSVAHSLKLSNTDLR
jgi:hypothetical protein